MQYILRGTLRGRNPPELYAPSSEAYEMLNGAVVGGPSLVFTRKHIAGQTRIRSHKYDLARIVKRILRFDANSLYPYTMTKEMPCGKEFVEHYEDPAQAAKDLIPRLWSKRWFGFAEVDIEVPRNLWEKFEKFLPLFVNQSVGVEGLPQHMKDYLAKSNRSFWPDQKKLLGVLKAKKDTSVRPSFGVVSQPRSQNHGRSPHDRLCTDGMYFALACDTLEEAVKPELREQFEKERKQWLSWDKWSSRKPGLFKLESEGTRTIALCSKCYKDVFQGYVTSPELAALSSKKDVTSL